MGFFHLLCFLSPATFVLLITTTPSSCRAKINFLVPCEDEEATYSQGSTYWANLNRLLSSFSSNITLTGEFRNTTIGHNPDTIYGLFQCRGDVTPQSCQACVKEASQNIIQKCPNQKNAIVWLDHCLLRIANRSFSSIMQTSPLVFYHNARNSSYSFDKISKRWMEGLVTQAAFGGSSNTYMFATGESNFGRAQEIYGLVQCIGDVSQSDCEACLRFEIDYLVSCCDGRVGGRVATPSCYMRYETYRFYDSKLAVAVPAPPLNGKTGKRSNSHIAIIVNASVIPLVILLAFLLYYLWRKIRIKREKENRRAISLFDSGKEGSDELKGNSKGHQMKSYDLPVIHLDVIIAATDNFSDANKLGQGGFGLVYKGTFHDGKEIAVKRLESSSRQGVEEFKNEVILISKLQHKNLVRLLGCCIQGDEKLLIYEYMPNTSLDSFLFDPWKCDQLDWGRRHNIINGIARGLLYLHEDSRLKIIHRDLKASNVLLDHELNAKISDFGTARIVERNQDKANTTRVVGTYGYMAPEYAMEGLFSVKSDVFSFGVLLLEIISGKRNTGFHLSGHDQSLLTYAWRLWCENKGLEIMDPLLMADDQSSNVNSEEVLQCIHIGLLCVQEDPVDRPTMSSVVLMLASANNSPISFPQPTEPAFSVGRGAVAASSLNGVSFSSVSPR